MSCMTLAEVEAIGSGEHTLTQSPLEPIVLHDMEVQQIRRSIWEACTGLFHA